LRIKSILFKSIVLFSLKTLAGFEPGFFLSGADAMTIPPGYSGQMLNNNTGTAFSQL
jgi:hypothetical protein